MKKLETKLSTSISLVSIFIFCFILVVIRWINIFNSYIFVINETINSHITNFTLSVLLCVLIGYLLQLFGKKYNSNIIVGMVIILSNFIYEIFLPILNTTDIVDAVYGLVGTIISLIYLYIISKYGFKTNK
ncbi:MAG: hypothetical protein SO067_02810 [Bacilli bacterium]|jgi:hypothetical protein|nr:hypothetical protein [Clostridium sp.]MDY3798035.1 hypothetical protein [Bacilli bacterium]CDE95209.1 putative uncharacterized protein [Clostridium sp. CAG:914]